MTDSTPPAGGTTPPEATPKPATESDSRFTWGALVAIMALAVLGLVFGGLIWSGAKPSPEAFASLTTAVVAIASAYFGIQVAGKAATTANTSAAAATKAADSAHAAATKATESTQNLERSVASNREALVTNNDLLEQVRAHLTAAPVPTVRQANPPKK